MSLIGIAIVGKKNEPLYLCECTRFPQEESDDPASAETADASSSSPPDPFGFLQSTTASTAQGNSLNMEQQFVLHAALDRLEEHVGSSKPDGTMPLRKSIRRVNSSGTSTATTTSSSGSTSAPSSSGKKSTNNSYSRPSGQWLGLLTVQDEASAVYGYVTATNIKFLALLEHPTGATSHQTKEMSQEQSRAVRTLLTTLHGHYITYLLNPFQPIGEINLDSDSSFNRKVRTAVKNFAA